jgi:hypothetical protein
LTLTFGIVRDKVVAAPAVASCAAGLVTPELLPLLLPPLLL